MGKHWIWACSAFLLIGCAPEQTTTSSPSLTPEPSSSPVTVATLEAFLSQAGKGFKAEGIFRQGSEAAYYTSNCVDVAIGTVASTMTTYPEVIDPGIPSRKNGTTYRYEMYPYGGKFVTTLTELGIDNVVDRYFATDGTTGAYLEWGTASFSSFFYDLKAEDFAQDGDVFRLKMEEPSLSEVYVGIGSQLSGYTGLTLSSFELSFEDGELPSYKAAFEPYQSSTIGLTNSGVSGVFVYAGQEACVPLEPLPEQEADPLFSQTMAKLQKGDYSVDIEGTATHIKAQADDGVAISYELLDDNDKRTAAYGYRNVDSSHVQGMTEINGKLYPDGPAIEGQLSMMLPSFAMSPIFFDKETTEEGTLYTLKEDIDAVCNYYDYGTMAGETVGTVKLLIKDDSVVVTNEFGGAKETFTYTDLGAIDGLLDTLQPNGDALTWKEVLSNDLDEYAVLLETIPEAALAMMPTVGGQYNHFTCDASYKPGRPVFIYSFASYDYDEAEGVLRGYEAKLLESGFVKENQTGVNNGSVYAKDIEIDGSMKKLELEVLVGVSLLSAPRLLIYPTLSE